LIFTELISAQDIAEVIAKEILKDHIIPAFIFNERKYRRIVVVLKYDAVHIGMAYGIIEHGTHDFFLHFIYIMKEYRKHKIVVRFLGDIFNTAIADAGAKVAIWRYGLKDNEKDVRSLLLAELPFCLTVKVDKEKDYCIKTKDFDFIRKFNSLKSLNLDKMGYHAQKWAECNDELKMKIHEGEERARCETKYLSPFIYDTFDTETSFVLVRKEMQKPAGWIICQRYSEKEIRLFCFYLYPEDRVGYVGLSFLAYVMEKIALLFESFHFGVDDDNSQMERFVNNYCVSVIEPKGIRCFLKVDFA